MVKWRKATRPIYGNTLPPHSADSLSDRMRHFGERGGVSPPVHSS